MTKKFLFFMATSLLIVSCSSYKRLQTDGGVVKVNKNDFPRVMHFLNMNFHQYKGKPVGVLIDSIIPQSLGQGFFEEEPVAVARCFTTEFPNNVSLKVYIKKRFRIALDSTVQWDLDKYKKEELLGIKLFYKNKCIKWYEDY